MSYTSPTDHCKFRSHSKETRQKISAKSKGRVSNNKGKTYEDIYGLDRAKIEKEKRSVAHIGKKGHVAWNTGLTKETDGRVKNMADALRVSHPMRGKHHTDETKKKISVSNLGKHHTKETKDILRLIHLGKPHSLESKQCQSKTLIEQYKNGERIPPMKGKHHSEETKQKMSEKSKNRWKLKEFREKIKKAYVFRQPTYRDTKPELILRYELNKIGIPFTTYEPIIGQPDIYFPLQKLCVFADGCYWHGCPIHCPEKFEKCFNHDYEIDRQLEKLGYRVLRFYECDIEDNTEWCINGIIDVLNKSGV